MNNESGDSFEITLDPKAFVERVLSFPSFKEAKLNRPYHEILDIILDAYRNDNLTEEQDLIVELILHLQDESTPFNLKRAREIWDNQDKKVFIQMMTETESGIGI